MRIRTQFAWVLRTVIPLLILAAMPEHARAAYCSASGGCDEYIYTVQVGTINNTATTCNNYADYTASHATIMDIGTPYTITIIGAVAGTPYYGYDGDQLGIWIDWNQDQDFDDADETVYTVENYGYFTTTITPPVHALSGSTRMRIRLMWIGTLSPCGSTTYGEVEDYTITIPATDNGAISGTKFNDLDEDGNWDPGEPGLPDWEIYLDLNTNRAWDPGEPKEITNGDGYYEFTGLAPGLYVIDEVDQPGWHQTHPGNEGRYTESLDVDEIVTSRDFGNRPITGTLVCLQAIEDTYAKSSAPETNYGAQNSVTSGMFDGTVYRAFIKFDLSVIPPGNVVTRAKLRLENGFISIPAPQLDAPRLSDHWDESTVTWNNQPMDAYIGLISFNRSLVDGDETFWDVTEDVDADYTIDGFYSVKIISADESLQQRADFWSKDFGWPPMAPTLEVEYQPIFGGGTGEPNDPYQIWTGEQFNNIGLYPHRWSKHYKLMADISLAAYTGYSYNKIGVSSPYTGDGPFSGVFDGNFHSISDFSYFAASSSENNVGLFGYAYDAAIRNLRIIAPNIYTNYYSQNYVGSLVGSVESADIAGCSVIGGSVDGQNYVGGLVGLCRASYIAACSSSASVSGTNSIGGLIGDVPAISGFPKITDCYASGSVTGTDYVGGFIADTTRAVIVNCYSTGRVNGTTNVGGFSGHHDPNWFPFQDHVINCFWDIDSSNTPNSPAATGLHTPAMQNIDTYLNAGWDFAGEIANGGSDEWAMPPAAGYPLLWHELDPTPPLPTFAAGTGSIADPYLIETGEQLNSIGHNPRLMNKHFKLTQDLDLQGSTYHVIAPRPYEFTGTFDGDYHNISNLNPDCGLTFSCAGFLCSLKGPDACIKNLTLIEPNIVAEWGWGVGSLVGVNDGAGIINCHALNANVEGLLGIGGLAGVNMWYGTISASSATGNASQSLIYGPITYSPVGGLVGENSFWAQIQQSFAKCNVSGDDCVGGLVGINVLAVKIKNSYAAGNVHGTADYVGGLIGRNFSGTETHYCYSSCTVTGPNGTDAVGALVGKMGTSGSERYTSCFWDVNVCPDFDGIGNGADPNVIGQTTQNMQLQTTFTDARWDFIGEGINGPNDVWDICENMNYPRLAWQISPADLICPYGVNAIDLAHLAHWWMQENCQLTNNCDGADLDLSGIVDGRDLKILCDRWLAAVQ